MNTPIPENTLARIKEALLRGRKIEAVKLHREATGSGLAEAKTEIEKLEVRPATTTPARSATM